MKEPTNRSHPISSTGQEEDALLCVRVCVCVCRACACVCVSHETSSSDDVFEQGKKKALFSDMGSHNLQQVQVDKSPLSSTKVDSRYLSSSSSSSSLLSLNLTNSDKIKKSGGRQ